MQGPGSAAAAAAAPTRSSFQVDRSKSTTTAAAANTDYRQRSASVSQANETHRHGFGETLSRFLAPSRKKSSSTAVPTSLNGAIATNGLAGPPPVPLGRTSTFRLRTPVIPGTATLASGGPSSSSSPAVPQLRALDSYNARNVAAALDPNLQTRQTDDVWQQVCIRVLPLFNGEGIRGFIEDLNELVLTHVQRTFLRCQSSRPAFAPSANPPSLNLSSLVTGLITADLTDLIRIGLVTLANKLSPPSAATTTSSETRPISDEKLLARLNEIWLFFFTGVLPHLEGVFWVLRSDDRLRAAAATTGEAASRSSSSSTAAAAGTSGAHALADTRIDVRRIALIEFRDCIIHPEMDRLIPIFASFYPPPQSSSSSSGGGGKTPRRATTGTGYDSQPSTRPPSRSQQYGPSETNSSSHASAFAAFQRARSTPPPGSPSPQAYHSSHPGRPDPSPRQQSSPSRLSPNPEYRAARPSGGDYPRSPGMRTASGGGGGNGSQLRPSAQFPPRRTASHGSAPPFSPSSNAHFTRNGEDTSAGLDNNGTSSSSFARNPAEAQALARRRQMIAILASLLTADDRQAEMDELVRSLRPVYNKRYRVPREQPPPPEEEEERRGNDSEEDGDRTYTDDERTDRDRSGFTTPPAAGNDSSGVVTSLTASPIMLGQELPRDHVPELDPLPAPIPLHLDRSRLADTTLDGTSRQISARQRSRTMNSLDEEQAENGGGGYKVASSRSPRLSGMQDQDGGAAHPQRHSIDVAVLLPPSIPRSASAASSSPSAILPGKKTRRLSFRPWLGRSNSAVTSSSAASTSGEGSSLALHEDGTALDAAAALTPGTVEGDRLRRGLLRRNSSRRTSDLSAVVPQLGVGYGQVAEDLAAHEEAELAEEWRERRRDVSS
ncbi:hypothetical protein JCM10908_006421 [Rhodotorula pacifica]|uniref:HbrB domain-containing protein n=1 Tax=Rhodotorula pacifica TaxID=1495444 RepID=UPI00316C1F6A